MRIQLFLFSLVILISANSSISYAKDYSCKEALENEVELTVTETFTAYLKALYDDGLLNQNDLIQFAETIETTQAIPNPFATVKHKSSDHDLHEPALEDYIANQNLMDIDQILNWTRNFVGIAKKIDEQKSTMSVHTAVAYLQMTFSRIEIPKPEPKAESLYKKAINLWKTYRLDPYEKEQIPLDRSFEMMNTLVTQAMWAEVTGFKTIPNSHQPTYAKATEQKKTIPIKGESYSLWPDDPIMGISWWSAIEFANRLSIKKGLTPVYDMSRIQFYPDSSFEGGNLMPRGQGEAQKLRINKKANGYRLPTKKEYDLVATNRKATADICSEKNAEIIKKQSEAFARSTALYHPTLFEDQLFYDLHTGLGEWLNDPSTRPGNRVIRRKSKLKLSVSPPEYSYWDTLNYWEVLTLMNELGFRLVRTVD